MSAAQVLFYCHFPDMLLATRASRLRGAYRAPLDALEQSTTGMVWQPRRGWRRRCAANVTRRTLALAFANRRTP